VFSFRSFSLLLHTGSIVNSNSSRGIYHYNTYLTLDLDSIHYSSGKPRERFEVIVMETLESYDERTATATMNEASAAEALDKAVLSFAIDEFPRMDESAIEQYWNVKIKRRREERSKIFADLVTVSEERLAAHEESIASAKRGAQDDNNELGATKKQQEKNEKSLVEMNDVELLRYIDSLQGVNADEAKALLRERYIHSDLSQLTRVQLGNVIESPGEDPLRKKIAMQIVFKGIKRNEL
jgi:hypothetical protein